MNRVPSVPPDNQAGALSGASAGSLHLRRKFDTDSLRPDGWVYAYKALGLNSPVNEETAK